MERTAIIVTHNSATIINITRYVHEDNGMITLYLDDSTTILAPSSNTFITKNLEPREVRQLSESLVMKYTSCNVSCFKPQSVEYRKTK